MRSRIQIFTILLGAFALVGCHDVMSPAIITPPPGKIIYTKVDLRNYPIEDGSVKLVDPVSLEETKLGAGMVRSRPQQGRVAWAKRRNAELWDIVVTDPNGSNTMNAGQIDTRDRTLYGDGPVLSPTLDKVAFTVKEIVDFSGDPNERWQTYIHEPGTQAEYLSGEVFWWDGGNNEATAHEKEVMPAFSPAGDWLMKFTWVEGMDGPAYLIFIDTVSNMPFGTQNTRGAYWYFEGQENGEGFSAQEYGRMQIEWSPTTTSQDGGDVVFSISNKVFLCRYETFLPMTWWELGAGAWPTFSRDGSLIAYASANGDIEVVQSEDQTHTFTFSPPATKYFAYPQWSVDGSKILCTLFDEPFDQSESRFKSIGHLVVIDVETSSMVEVNQDPVYRGYWIE